MTDFVIEGSGIPALLDAAQRYEKPRGRGRLVLLSSHSSTAKEFDFREAINRGLSIIVAHPNYSTSEDDDFRRAVELMNNGTFKVRELITHEFRLADIKAGV